MAEWTQRHLVGVLWSSQRGLGINESGCWPNHWSASSEERTGGVGLSPLPPPSALHTSHQWTEHAATHTHTYTLSQRQFHKASRLCDRRDRWANFWVINDMPWHLRMWLIFMYLNRFTSTDYCFYLQSNRLCTETETDTPGWCWRADSEQQQHEVAPVCSTQASHEQSFESSLTHSVLKGVSFRVCVVPTYLWGNGPTLWQTG